MRRVALLLGLHRITVARKLHFLAQQARIELSSSLRPISQFQFDELETFEQTKCKPLSVVMAVLPGKRTILGFEVAIMPAKGPLAERSRKKYGRRRDLRGPAIDRLFSRLRPFVADRSILVSDSNPRYPAPVRKHFPTAEYLPVPGGRSSSTGGGELKRLEFDPLFSLNHTFAMLRANINRLFRKTWCTTKKASALADHLALYAQFHNSVLISS